MKSLNSTEKVTRTSNKVALSKLATILQSFSTALLDCIWQNFINKSNVTTSNELEVYRLKTQMHVVAGKERTHVDCSNSGISPRDWCGNACGGRYREPLNNHCRNGKVVHDMGFA